MVVVVDEGVEVGLELGEGRRRGVVALSHFLRVWWKRSTLPQVVGWLGLEFFWTTPGGEFVLEPLRPPLPPERRVVNTMPLSVRVEAGIHVVSQALRNGQDDGAGDAAVGGDGERVAGVVVDPARISIWVPSASTSG